MARRLQRRVRPRRAPSGARGSRPSVGIKDRLKRVQPRHGCLELGLGGIVHIPTDLVVKSQPTDIIDIILCPIKRPNSVYIACRVRKSGGELLSIAEVLWSTTKSDGMCDFLSQPERVPMGHAAA